MYVCMYACKVELVSDFSLQVTIGASLPIRTTLNDILCSGDAVHSIVGIMSVSSGMVS